jgi:Uma2 family endonuclease
MRTERIHVIDLHCDNIERMSVETRRPATDRVIVRNVSWKTYKQLLRDLENCSSPRLAFDQGVLEVMSPHLEHEETNRTLAAMVEIILEELNVNFRNAGSTTFKREDLDRGFEPDSSFYIQTVEQIRAKKRINLGIDPPPDLIIEVDLTQDSLNKFPLYAALGVPEVWRYEDSLEIWALRSDRYTRRQTSFAIPVLTEQIVGELLRLSHRLERPAWLRQARRQLRALARS